MKTFLKTALICLPLFIAAPSPAQFHWGIDLHFGAPTPAPYPDAVWAPGYYYYDPYYYHYTWVPGRWNRGHHYGWNRGGFRGREVFRGGRGRGHGRGRH